jgi:leucyl aminopeptidase
MADMEIAGEDTALCPKGATGFGVQLLNRYLRNLESEKK